MADTVEYGIGNRSSAAAAGTMALGLLLACAATCAHAGTAAAASARPAAQVRFSAMSELTPENVGALMPLSEIRAEVGLLKDATPTSGPPTRGAVAKLGSLVRADERLREFVSFRSTLSAAGSAGSAESQPAGSAISFVEGPVVAGLGVPAGALVAWDAAHRRVLWTVNGAGTAGADAVVTGGGLLLYCSQSGWFRALDARTGALLWQYKLAGASGETRGTPVSYRGPDGHQYIAVLANIRGRWGTLRPFSLPR